MSRRSNPQRCSTTQHYNTESRALQRSTFCRFFQQTLQRRGTLVHSTRAFYWVGKCLRDEEKRALMPVTLRSLHFAKSTTFSPDIHTQESGSYLFLGIFHDFEILFYGLLKFHAESPWRHSSISYNLSPKKITYVPNMIRLESTSCINLGKVALWTKSKSLKVHHEYKCALAFWLDKLFLPELTHKFGNKEFACFRIFLTPVNLNEDSRNIKNQCNVKRGSGFCKQKQNSDNASNITKRDKQPNAGADLRDLGVPGEKDREEMDRNTYPMGSGYENRGETQGVRATRRRREHQPPLSAPATSACTAAPPPSNPSSIPAPRTNLVFFFVQTRIFFSCATRQLSYAKPPNADALPSIPSSPSLFNSL
ncbi:hypothetical protein M5K25_007203 [Dendrobium thyrsiflorum]|uniref:Uncharacterized protein n=1 Tax=Dendrobium thyrsiflorum TaxID=117978 RepID=A0ABD0VKX6_DENTH